MARAPKTKRNDTRKRLEWISKNHPPRVLEIVTSAAAEARGVHNVPWFDLLYEGVEYIDEPDTARYDRLLAKVAETMPGHSRYDRHLPWVAQRITKRLKAIEQARGNVERGTAEYRLENAQEIQARLRSVVDWAEATGADLSKYSIEDAIQETDEWSSTDPVKAVPPGKVVYKWDDGWTVQELGLMKAGHRTVADYNKAKAELEAEGEVMQHCVDGYDPNDIPERFRIFSLRDPAGRPHATMEWVPGEQYAAQLRGKQNARPKNEYLARMTEFRENTFDDEEVGRIADGEYDHLLPDFMGRYELPEYMRKPGMREEFILTGGRPGAFRSFRVYRAENVDAAFEEFYEAMAESHEFDGDPDDFDSEEEFEEAEQDSFRRAFEQVVPEYARRSALDKAGEVELPDSWGWYLLKFMPQLIWTTDDEMVYWMTDGDWTDACRFLEQRGQVANPPRRAKSSRAKLKAALMRG